MLEAAGVDLVLAGHSHGYERSFLIDQHYGLSNTFNSGHLVDGGDGRIDGDGAYRKLRGPHGGTVYVVAGNAGVLSSQGTYDHPAMFLGVRRLGSVVLDVDRGQLDFEALDDAGATLDYLTLIKGVTPAADFGGSPTSGNVPLPVTFTDQSSGSPTSWSWAFGDGTTSTVQNPSHTYSGAGRYTVSLTVTNGVGSDTLVRRRYITVQPTRPLPASTSGYVGVSIPPPTAAFSGRPTSGSAALLVFFTDQSTGAPTAWSWDFGDGNTSTARNPIHIYTSPRSYTVTLTVRNDDGSDTLVRRDYITVNP
jgi:PKD repeat protein